MEGHLFYFKYVQVIDFSLEDESCHKESDTIFFMDWHLRLVYITHENGSFEIIFPLKEWPSSKKNE